MPETKGPILPAEIENEMKAGITANILKYQAGQTIFCPGCGACLDWRSTVSVDFIGIVTGKMHATSILCSACADKLLPGIDQRLAKAEATAKEKLQVITTDGRDWNEEEEYDPPPPCKLGKQIQLLTSHVDGPKRVTGYQVDSGLPDWATWFVYHHGESKTFWLVEARTGFAVARGDNAKSATINAYRRLHQVGREKFDRAVKGKPTLNKL